jgi:hypothetical protein
MSAVLFVVLVGVATLGWLALSQTEAERLQRAQHAFEGSQYATAATAYDALVHDYPSSEQQDQYEFMARLSQAFADARDPKTSPAEAFHQFDEFARRHADSATYHARAADLGRCYAEYAARLAEAGQGAVPGQGDPVTTRRGLDAGRKLAGDAHAALASATRVGTSQPAPEVAAAVTGLDRAVLLAERRLADLVSLQQFLERPRPDSFYRAHQLVARSKLEQDPWVKQALGQLADQVYELVRYIRTDTEPSPSVAADTDPGGLLVVPAVRPAAADEPPNDGIVIAIARGVLYGLSRRDGHARWAQRVGVDVTRLPVHVSARESSADLILVLSGGNQIVTARQSADGRPLWRQPLTAACTGQPVVVDGRVLVPTIDGLVHEIDLASGNRLGHYALGQALRLGAVRASGSNLIYVPADEFNIYVLDVARRRCVGILQTGHPAGSLRGLPIVVSATAPTADAGPSDFLVICQEDGLEHVKFRAFRLPVERLIAESPSGAEPRLAGWCWFPPSFDGENISALTDQGASGVIGVNQPQNADPPLFAFVQPSSTLAPPLSRVARSAVAHADADNLWLLCHGGLEYVRVGLGRRSGLHQVSAWAHPTPVGEPLHEAHIGNRHSTLYVFTEDLMTGDPFASAVAGTTGQIRWRRRLGLQAGRDPLTVGANVLLADRSGGIVALDPTRRQDIGGPWHTAAVAEASSPGKLIAGPHLIPAPDGSAAHELCCVTHEATAGQRAGVDLVLRTFKPGQSAFAEQRKQLPETLAGTPAVGPDAMVLPLADGSLYRLSLLGEGRLTGVSWRAADAPRGGAGNVLYVGPGAYITTDGSRTVVRWRWPGDGEPQEVARADLPAPVAAPPVLGPAASTDAEPLIFISDAGGSLSALNSTDLKVAGRWPLGGKISAGPYRLGETVACVVDRDRLVWLDSRDHQNLREFRTQGAAIVGQPRLVGDSILVADESGRVVTLDPVRGAPLGNPSDVPPGTSPAAAPVAFGPDNAFVPLTDGTVLLLPLRKAE